MNCVIELDPNSVGMMIAVARMIMFLRESIEQLSVEMTSIYSNLEEEIACS
jgi:hypothetical protein